jgi:hypothetical protein
MCFENYFSEQIKKLRQEMKKVRKEEDEDKSATLI